VQLEAYGVVPERMAGQPRPAERVLAYARRGKNVDRMILACFLLKLSTRKVAVVLLPVLGRPVSPATVSQVAKQLAVAAFHRRPLKDPKGPRDR
jgi:transposase-like protein